MKSSALIKMTVIALLTLGLTVPVQADDLVKNRTARKPIVLTVDKPILEYVAKIYSEELQKDDIYRVQKFLSQIENVTITFRDKDAADYVLVFKELDDQMLEQWMFDEGYLGDTPEDIPVESWMSDLSYLE